MDERIPLRSSIGRVSGVRASTRGNNDLSLVASTINNQQIALMIQTIQSSTNLTLDEILFRCNVPVNLSKRVRDALRTAANLKQISIRLATRGDTRLNVYNESLLSR